MCAGSAGRTVAGVTSRSSTADAERARLARELHDVVSHAVSAIVVQAAAARDVFERHPERALEALAAIEGAGRDALTELRTLVALDHEDDRLPPRAPQPRLERLPALVEQVRAAGLAVQLEADACAGLPAAVDLSAYRMVHVALANVVQHSRASAAAVALRRTPLRLEVAVTDNGRGCASGSGDDAALARVRERFRLLGGGLTAGPRPAGGFAVRAWLPLAA